MALIHRPLIPILILLLLGGAATAAAQTRSPWADEHANTPHLRGVNEVSEALVRQGLLRSPSIRNLQRTIARSDVIVYVRLDPSLTSRTHGRTMLAGEAGCARYVFVDIAWGLPERRALAVLAHEIQHAAEIAANAAVTDADSLVSAISAIGWVTGRGTRGRMTLETRRAMEVEARVGLELDGQAGR